MLPPRAFKDRGIRKKEQMLPPKRLDYLICGLAMASLPAQSLIAQTENFAADLLLRSPDTYLRSAPGRSDVGS
jgi:hypothetical protein